MEKYCIFRVQSFSGMYRVLESSDQDNAGRYEYRIMHNRRVLERFRRTNGRRAIELCMRYAMGCGVDINWEEEL